MLPVILAMAGGAIVGAVVGVSAEKKKLLEKPVYRVLLTDDKNVTSYIDGTLLAVWGTAMALTGQNKSIVHLELRAPDNKVIRTWDRV